MLKNSVEEFSTRKIADVAAAPVIAARRQHVSVEFAKFRVAIGQRLFVCDDLWHLRTENEVLVEFYRASPSPWMQTVAFAVNDDVPSNRPGSEKRRSTYGRACQTDGRVRLLYLEQSW